MINLYLPGNSPLHRAPAGAKLLALAVLAVLLTALPPSWMLVGLSVLIPGAAYLLARMPATVVLRDLRATSLLVVFLVATQLIFSTPMAAVGNTARVLGVVLLAQAITRTTRVEDMIALTERALGPLRRVGVRPDRVGLAMALALTSVGQIGQITHQVRDAQRSRGVRLAPWSWVMPVLVLSLRHADEVGDALDARGVVD